MTRRATLPLHEPIPDVVRDEAIIVAPNETNYELYLDDASVEAMSRGILPEAVALRCWGMLEWKRRHYRNDAREAAFNTDELSPRS